MDLEEDLARDTLRARAMLQDIFGEIRLVEAGEELYAEFESPLRKLPRQVDSSKLEFPQRASARDSALAAGYPARRADGFRCSVRSSRS